jgi:hypothetical protein
VIGMMETPEQSRGGGAARRARRFGQPASTQALRPSQRRAARNRAARRERDVAEHWLRRLGRP